MIAFLMLINAILSLTFCISPHEVFSQNCSKTFYKIPRKARANLGILHMKKCRARYFCEFFKSNCSVDHYLKGVCKQYSIQTLMEKIVAFNVLKNNN